MRRYSINLARWFGPDRRARTRPSRRPEVEAVEGRRLLSAVVPHAHVPVHVQVHTHVPTATASAPVVNPVLRPYRVFVATITQGKDAGTTIEGPIVLGYSGRIQFIGFFYPKKGGRGDVFGTETGGGATFTIDLPTGGSIQAGGAGQLQGVRGGLPGGDSLVGFGHFYGPGPGDQGTWETLAPSKAGGL